MSLAIKQDAQIKELLGQLDQIRTARTFNRWKRNFLDRWESFLDNENTMNADKAYRDFSKLMDSFVKMVEDVNAYIDKQELTPDKATVKARNSLNEMTKVMVLVNNEKDALIPQTNTQEKKRGYNKFHMGAVLIRDNFNEYGRLVECKETLQHMRTTSLNEVADKQQLEEMDNFSVKLAKFCEIMADLGIFEVMLKCREFADEKPDLGKIIFIDIKTIGLGELSREECLEQRVLTSVRQDANGNDIFNEAAATEEAEEKLLKIIKEHPTLGVGVGQKNNQYQNEDEEVGVSNAAEVQNMWGVKLRKTPKNKKGEELIFIDQKTGAYGEMSRATCLEKGILQEVPGEKGKITLAQAQNDFEDRSELIERIRILLKLGV